MDKRLCKILFLFLIGLTAVCLTFSFVLQMRFTLQTIERGKLPIYSIPILIINVLAFSSVLLSAFLGIKKKYIVSLATISLPFLLYLFLYFIPNEITLYNPSVLVDIANNVNFGDALFPNSIIILGTIFHGMLLITEAIAIFYLIFHIAKNNKSPKPTR